MKEVSYEVVFMYMKKEKPSKDFLGRPLKDFSGKDWWGIPRKEIDWFPRIDYERCVGCGLCIVTCAGRLVYEWDPVKDKPVVARPYNCMVGCDTCAKLCPMDAIYFPPLGYVRKLRDKARAVAKAKSIIKMASTKAENK